MEDHIDEALAQLLYQTSTESLRPGSHWELFLPGARAWLTKWGIKYWEGMGTWKPGA